jgi:hypothetical protein
MFASLFTEVLIFCLLYSNESEESDESDEYNNKRKGYFTTDLDSDSLEWIDDCDDSDSDSDCSYEYESDSSDYHNRFEKHSKQNGPDKIKQDESKPSIPRRIWSDSDSFEYYDWESSDNTTFLRYTKNVHTICRHNRCMTHYYPIHVNLSQSNIQSTH